MKIFRIHMLMAGLLMAALSLQAQQEYKEELRAPWVATVSNIDWPTSRWDDAADQKADLIEMLDLYESLNMNAIFLQVRPECDALYQSNLEPWSRYVSGTQGEYPGYDPLAFALEEAHKRGIEVHAWMNPYRINASANPSDGYFAEGHVYLEHPEWAMKYTSGKWILNPGLPEVMSYIGSVVRDLLENYELDGVHFDDYFYAYGGTSSDLDQTEYDLYNEGMGRGDWRRDNVNRMIDTVYSVIQDVNPSVRFGVSPFGIWRPGYPSGIVGMDAYASIYCDPLAWLEDQTVDYITPQLYWPTGGGQDFESLANWWSDQVQAHNRHFYPGHGTYRLSDNPGAKAAREELSSDLHEHKQYMNLSQLESSLKGTSDPVAGWTLGQIGLQIDIMRSNHDKGALGSVFFSAADFTRVIGLSDYMKENKYTHKTLLPVLDWKPDDTPATPINLRQEQEGDEYFLRWDFTLSGNQRIAIYVGDQSLSEEQIVASANNLQAISFGNEISFSQLDYTMESIFVVSAVSATGRESAPSESLDPDHYGPGAVITGPDDGASLAENGKLSWAAEGSATEFQVQVATNELFSNVIFDSDWTTQKELAISNLALEGEVEYFWRVRAREGITGPFTGTVSFVTGFPVTPTLTQPGVLEQGLSKTPLIAWDASAAAESILVQISERGDFNPLTAEETFPAAPGSANLETILKTESWYYIRIASLNAYGESEFDQYRAFRTGDGVWVGSRQAGTEIKVWPNPLTEGPLHIMSGNSEDAIRQISLYDPMGKLLFQASFDQAQQLSIAAEHFPSAGLYILKTEAIEGSSTQLIVVQ